MTFLDFIKNRGAQQQTAQSPAPSQPETAKQMYTREAAQEKTNPKLISLSAESAASAKEAGALFRRGTEAPGQNPAAPRPAPQDGASSPQPMAQLSMNQDKAAPALSPTSAQAGVRSTEQDGPSAGGEKASPPQEQAKRTMARATPSWER